MSETVIRIPESASVIWPDYQQEPGAHLLQGVGFVVWEDQQ